MTAMTVTNLFGSYRERLTARLTAESHRVANFIDRRLTALLGGWVVLTIIAGGIRLLMLQAALPKLARFETMAGLVITYLFVAAAPVAGYALTRGSFPSGKAVKQPSVRLARIGRWVDLTPVEAHQQPNFGVAGLLVSLVAGLLLSLTMRSAEYWLAMPAVPDGAAPWALALFRIMTFDLIFISFLYAVCITMALRAVPLFPRMLAYTWLCDVLMQVAIARYTINAGGLPSEVAGPLQAFLLANVKKVLISVMIWLPYLLVSNRVNLTFRQRVRHQTVFAG